MAENLSEAEVDRLPLESMVDEVLDSVFVAIRLILDLWLSSGMVLIRY